jgi:hypothetical protein
MTEPYDSFHDTQQHIYEVRELLHRVALALIERGRMARGDAEGEGATSEEDAELLNEIMDDQKVKEALAAWQAACAQAGIVVPTRELNDLLLAVIEVTRESARFNVWLDSAAADE